MERYGSHSKVQKVVIKIYNDKNSKEAEREIKFYKSTSGKTGRYICKLLHQLEDRIILEDCGVPLLEFLKGKQDDYKYFLEQISSAVATIHKLGYFHGDLNYTNVLVDYRSNIKICDFTSSDLITEESQLQTFAEGFEDPDAGNPVMSDIYSMGIIFWCVFSKKIPPMNYKLVSSTFDSEMNPIVERSKPIYHSEILCMEYIDSDNYKDIILKMTGRISERPKSSLEIYNICINESLKV